MLFAAFEPFSRELMLLLFIIFVVGTRQMCKTLKGSDAARGAAKQGAMFLLRNLFKK